jgi:hypothetical protein
MYLTKDLKRLISAIGICFFIVIKSYGQDKSIPQELYKTSGIPDSLKEDANSVVRYSMDEILVKGPGKMNIKHHSLTTILNEKGDREAVIQLAYNKKYDNYSFVDVHIYNSDGKVIKKYHKSDMYDGLASDDETLVNDERFLGLKHTVVNYPETIEIEYEENITSLIDLGKWLIQEPEQSVQNAYYHISIDSTTGFRYLNRNTSLKPIKTKQNYLDSYLWQASNLKAIKIEEGAKSWRVLPAIKFAANKFEFYGIPGDISSWQNYGKWQQILNTDVCTLSPQRVDEIKKMTDTIKTDKEKAAFLYKYMQQNMRYVSIQLGIGGLKPFPATFVDQKKYGDCKALSNYMCALLKAVNINSYYTIINAGTNAEPANYAFPSDPFNHVILCIPFKNDTTWLECTSSTMPFGKLGSFTENRNALLVTEDGGKLVSTPKSTPTENQINSEAHIILDADGGAKTQVKILSTGEYREMFVEIAAIKLDEQKKFLLQELHIKQPSAFDFKSEKDVAGTKEIDLDLDYDQFCDVKAGDKRFYRPLAFSLWAGTVPVVEKRKADYYFECPTQKSCITTIDLPEGFEVETLPANSSLKFSYGNYEINYVYNKDKNQVISTAKFILNNQIIPAAKYTEMQQYMDGIAKAQNKKLVIKKKA